MLKLLLLLPSALAGDAEDMFRAVNEARRVARHCGPVYNYPTKDLLWDERLHRAAMGHAQDMAARNYFSHQSPPPNSTNPCERSKAAGWTGWSLACAENLAAGQTTVGEAMEGLLGSSGHCANIMEPTSAKVGVGVATGGRYGKYYVQHFGPPEWSGVNVTILP
jgi:uncharacterized protein YkwD